MDVSLKLIQQPNTRSLDAMELTISLQKLSASVFSKSHLTIIGLSPLDGYFYACHVSKAGSNCHLWRINPLVPKSFQTLSKPYLCSSKTGCIELSSSFSNDFLKIGVLFGSENSVFLLIDIFTGQWSKMKFRAQTLRGLQCSVPGWVCFTAHSQNNATRRSKKTCAFYAIDEKQAKLEALTSLQVTTNQTTVQPEDQVAIGRNSIVWLSHTQRIFICDLSNVQIKWRLVHPSALQPITIYKISAANGDFVLQNSNGIYKLRVEDEVYHLDRIFPRSKLLPHFCFDEKKMCQIYQFPFRDGFADRTKGPYLKTTFYRPPSLKELATAVVQKGCATTESVILYPNENETNVLSGGLSAKHFKLLFGFQSDPFGKQLVATKRGKLFKSRLGTMFKMTVK